MEGSKRSKTSMARSVLHRVKTSNTTDTPDEHDMPTTPSSPAMRQSPAASSSSATAVSHPSQGHFGVQDTASVEQSVKKFRIYEALRSGDTSAIDKALQEIPQSNKGGSAVLVNGGLEGTSMLHLAVQCADVPTVEYVLTHAGSAINVNAQDKEGNTPLHVASQLGRGPVVQMLLQQRGINDTMINYQGRSPLDLAKNPDVFQQLQLARSIYVDSQIKGVQQLVSSNNYAQLEKVLSDSHFQTVVDVNGEQLATDSVTVESGGTLLHEAARKKDMKLIEVLLLNGADPFRRDRKGKLAHDVTKDEKTKAILKKSPAAAAAQRGIQEKAILGSGGHQAALGMNSGENALGGKEGREMKGYLKKWTNYTTGYKLRWFVLEDGVLSYYKHQDDHGSACRGAINTRIAQLHMDAQDKLRFEILGKSSVKYHLKANHEVEAKRWVWALNNAIRWGKDEAKADAQRQTQSNDLLKQAKLGQIDQMHSRDEEAANTLPSRVQNKGSGLEGLGGLARLSTRTANDGYDDDDDGATSVDMSVAGDDMVRPGMSHGNDRHHDSYEFVDDASSIDVQQPVQRDAFMIAAHSAKLQLELLAQMSAALQAHKSRSPNTPISEPAVSQALESFEDAVSNLKGLIGDLNRIARDRESFWQSKLDKETNVRRLWEDSMTRVAKEHEELENRIGESEDKRKRTRRALREALEGQPTERFESPQDTRVTETLPPSGFGENDSFRPIMAMTEQPQNLNRFRRKSTIAERTNLSDDEDDDDEEFFDAVDAGEVEVFHAMPTAMTTASMVRTPVITLQPTVRQEPLPVRTQPEVSAIPAQVTSVPHIEKNVQSEEQAVTKPQHVDSKDELMTLSWKGYEDPVRKRLKMDADDRPKISLWGILKSMIGKDMTKMTLPVSFNEPTSLLQRVAEDMEYTELLDTAAERADSTERMVYVATFAASEYASTIGRVAKPFNPLLGETYEYVRPDKGAGYRFFIEQVSHHPPIGAAWAESPKWDYYGESAVRSKFYGKSFEINPLGTWFLRLRPTSSGGKTELYTWKKVTSSVVGIITGSPTVDNYGVMEVKNHTTGEVCTLDFKQRGWKASSAFQVIGKVLDNAGKPRWSIGGRWNEKIYARLTPGYEATSVEPTSGSKGGGDQAFLVWESHARPTGIPFNLTPFGVTLNALPEALRPRLPPTDTRLRPDQRAMENGEYDFAATEKNRVEEKQRAARRVREQNGVEFVPKWFRKTKCSTTGEEFWEAVGASHSHKQEIDYWSCRAKGDFSRSESIF